MAVEGREVMAQLAEIEDAIDRSQPMTTRHVLFEVERVEELILAVALLIHH